MTDRDFINRVSKLSKYRTEDIKDILDYVEMQLKTDIVVDNREIKLLDLVFKQKPKKKHSVTNFYTGERYFIDGKLGVKIKMSADWKKFFEQQNEFQESTDS